jgi:hypothetical protein
MSDTIDRLAQALRGPACCLTCRLVGAERRPLNLGMRPWGLLTDVE